MSASPDRAALLAQARDACYRLRQFVRAHEPGGCRVLSLGDQCGCLLCAIDQLTALCTALEQTGEELALLKAALAQPYPPTTGGTT